LEQTRNPTRFSPSVKGFSTGFGETNTAR